MRGKSNVHPRIPRTKDGRPDLTVPAPRLNGTPDLSGVWEAERTPASEYARVLGATFERLQVDSQDVTDYMMNVFWDLRPEEQPLRPEAAAIVKQRAKQPGPVARCLPAGVPISKLVGSGANARVVGDDEEMQRFVPIEDLFKGRHFDRQIIVLCVSWYTSFKLSLRDLVIMMADRGISVQRRA